jgi:hypothetical protein
MMGDSCVPIQTDKPALFDRDLRSGVNLFVGAGFSRLAKNDLGDTLPTSNQLKDIIIREFRLEAYAGLDLAAAYQISASKNRDKLNSLLKLLFTVTDYGAAYETLRIANIKSVYTTNIDDLMYKIFSPRQGENSKILHDRMLFSAPRNPSSVIDYVALHGCVRHPDPKYIFTAGEISSAFAADQETWYVFQRELQCRPTIFVGYSMRDAGVLQAIHNSREQASNRWILLREAGDADKDVFRTLGFEVLVGDTEAFLEYVHSAFSGAPGETTLPTRTFSCGGIPTFAAAAQRPVQSFFLGSEPEWSDVYSTQVIKRRIFSYIKNIILSGENTVLVGVPLSGKTTLLKQLAVDLNGTDQCLYFDQLSISVCQEILAEASGIGGRIYVFIDNLIDSLEAIHLLIKNQNFRFIASEATYVFDSVYFRHGVKVRVVSCSELDPTDRQRIVDSVPQTLRRRSKYLDLKNLDDADEVGLFEALQRHVFDEYLRQRFRASLRAFEQNDQEAFDAYIMACYVAQCRSVVSFDMLYVFTRSKQKSYESVYAICDRIRDFLSELQIDGANDQDYFSVRSKALANLALSDITNDAFSRIFQRFHSVISERIIPDYLVFRRYAYDNDYARRAFPDVKTGQYFYEQLVARTNNPYDYQHGATYLSKMKEFKTAFVCIDKALSLSGGRIHSIRNSHARILFEANIDVVKANKLNNTARLGLDSSMQVLTECIQRDARKSYHLMRFCDQAVQYRDVYQDAESERWLSMARDGLLGAIKEAEIQDSQDTYNLRTYRRLLREIERRLSSSPPW